MSLQFATIPYSFGYLSVSTTHCFGRLCALVAINVPTLTPGVASGGRRSRVHPARSAQRAVAARRIVLTNIAGAFIILVSSMHDLRHALTVRLGASGPSVRSTGCSLLERDAQLVEEG